MSVEPTSLERSWNGLGLPLPAAPLKALHLHCVRFSSWVQGQNNTTSKCLCLIISVVSMPHFISISHHPTGMLQSKFCERLLLQWRIWQRILWVILSTAEFQWDSTGHKHTQCMMRWSTSWICKAYRQVLENCLNWSYTILSLVAQTCFYNIKILKITLKSSVTGTLYSQVYILLFIIKCIDNMKTVLVDDI